MALCLLPLARAFVAGPGLGLRGPVASAPSDPRVAIRGGVRREQLHRVPRLAIGNRKGAGMKRVAEDGVMRGAFWSAVGRELKIR